MSPGCPLPWIMRRVSSVWPLGGTTPCTGPTLSTAATIVGASVAAMMPVPPGTTVLNGADISPYAPSASRQTAENE